MPAPLSSLVDRWDRNLDPQIPGRVVVPPPARAILLAGLERYASEPMLAIVAGEREAEELAEDLALFADGVIQMPAWETLPFEHVSPNVVTMARRVEARFRLQSDEPYVVVASVRAVTQRVSPSTVEPMTLQRSKTYDFDSIVRALTEIGYTRTDRAEARGDMAVRGGIIDVFPPNVDMPIRFDFWGDQLDDIRTYHPTTQRSDTELDDALIFPAREVILDDFVRDRARGLLADAPWASDRWDRMTEGVTFQGMESWLPWFASPRTAIDEFTGPVVVFDPARCGERATDLITEEADLAAALADTWGSDSPEAGAHPPLYLPLDLDAIAARVLESPPHAGGPGDEGYEIRTLDAVAGDPESVASAINRWKTRSVDIVVAMDGVAAAHRVASVLGEHGADLPVVATVDAGAAAVTSIGIHTGFVFPAIGFGVVGEREVAGRRRAHRTARRGTRRQVADAYRDLNPGDFIVHHHHGIGRFSGLVHREIAGVERDYLLVEYAGEDRLYVPTDQLAAVTRYTGGESPRLSRMGGAEWGQTRARIRKEVAVVADQVVALHRKRAASP
ncbi:MAG: hypothetical protein GWP18_01830, partial [Proteobacteria bacterium]|nr:hypothetical protein [Pseudomonadota bacterium]